VLAAQRAYDRFASRTMFLLAVVIGLWLARRKSGDTIPKSGTRSDFQTAGQSRTPTGLGSCPRALLRYVIWAWRWERFCRLRGLAVALLLVPFCEGLSLVGMLVLLALAWRGLKIVWQQRQARRASAVATAWRLQSGSGCHGPARLFVQVRAPFGGQGTDRKRPRSVAPAAAGSAGGDLRRAALAGEADQILIPYPKDKCRSMICPRKRPKSTCLNQSSWT